MSFIIFAWIASISYGLVVIVSKLTSKYSIPNPWLFGFLYSLCTFLFTLIPAAFSTRLTLVPTNWTFIILAGLCFGLGTLFFTLSIFALDASVLGALFNFRTAFAVILASIILKESFSSWQATLIGIIFIAGLFSTTDEKLTIKSFFKFSTIIGLLTMLSIALQGIFSNLALKNNSYWTVSLWMPLLSTVFLLATLPLFWKDIQKVRSGQLGAIGLVAGFDAIATLALNKAFITNVGISSVIVSLPLSMVFAICFAIFSPSLLEKHTIKVYSIRVTAAIIMVIAALKLS